MFFYKQLESLEIRDLTIMILYGVYYREQMMVNYTKHIHSLRSISELQDLFHKNEIVVLEIVTLVL